MKGGCAIVVGSGCCVVRLLVKDTAPLLLEGRNADAIGPIPAPAKDASKDSIADGRHIFDIVGMKFIRSDRHRKKIKNLYVVVLGLKKIATLQERRTGADPEPSDRSLLPDEIWKVQGHGQQWTALVLACYISKIESKASLVLNRVSCSGLEPPVHAVLIHNLCILAGVEFHLLFYFSFHWDLQRVCRA